MYMFPVMGLLYSEKNPPVKPHVSHAASSRGDDGLSYRARKEKYVTKPLRVPTTGGQERSVQSSRTGETLSAHFDLSRGGD